MRRNQKVEAKRVHLGSRTVTVTYAAPSPPTTMSSGYEPLSQSPHVHFEENEGEDVSVEIPSPSPIHEQRDEISGRIRWIYFMFGAAVLLPWNGEWQRLLVRIICLFDDIQYSVLITATPFFLSRLIGSDLRSSFSSYLSITFTLANFAFLAHATATSQQVRHVIFLSKSI